MKYSPDLIKGVVIFPLNVMGVIPAFILWFTGKFESMVFGLYPSVLGTALIIGGLCVCWVTVDWFTDYGEGTPAPWAPPKKLVALGIYRHVRNPMMLGIWSVLLGEATLFQSVPVLGWFAFFAVLCLLFTPLWEEPDLERRLGDDYLLYKRNVPRWIPRLKPWTGKAGNDDKPNP